MARWAKGVRRSLLIAGSTIPRPPSPHFLIHFLIVSPICNPLPIILFRACRFMHSFLHYSSIHPFNKHLPSTCWDMETLTSCFQGAHQLLEKGGSTWQRIMSRGPRGSFQLGTHVLQGREGRRHPHSRGGQAEAQRTQVKSPRWWLVCKLKPGHLTSYLLFLSHPISFPFCLP